MTIMQPESATSAMTSDPTERVESSLVSIVEDDANVAQLISHGLRPLQVEVECYSNLQSFMENLPQQTDRHGCIVLDVFLPDGNGLKLLSGKTTELQQSGRPIIFISGYGDIPMAVSAMSHGSWSFLPKPLDLTKLRENVAQACRWSVDHRAEQRQIRQARARWQSLAPDEVAVAHLILEGLPNKAVSARLDVSLRTVESRRQAIFQKLGVQSVCQFARTAILAGVCSPMRSPRPDA